MFNFVYVSPEEVKPVKSELYKIIHEVQDIVRSDFTFQFKPVGSSSRNMITYDKKSNIGFDFDYDLEINDDEENYTPKEIRCIIKSAIDQVARKYGYSYCEDSTRVLTIKKLNRYDNRILYSCDFVLVHNCGNGKQKYIRFNKRKNNYTWEYQGGGFKYLDGKIKWLKDNGCWAELRDYYIYKKNCNKNIHKHSRSVFAESVNEMYHQRKCEGF
ncbi:MAG: hypothetical protein NC240_01050 [Clostridium sp.]|nr:hypothetical protein [Clostridium sp.]